MNTTHPGSTSLRYPRARILASGIAALLVGAALLRPDSAPAATLFWDKGGTGGSGNWDNGTTTNWSTIAPPVAANSKWIDANVAQFSGVGGTVTLIDSVATAALTFTANGYNLTDDSGNGILNLNGATITTNRSSTPNKSSSK